MADGWLTGILARCLCVGLVGIRGRGFGFTHTPTTCAKGANKGECGHLAWRFVAIMFEPPPWHYVNIAVNGARFRGEWPQSRDIDRRIFAVAGVAERNLPIDNNNSSNNGNCAPE